MVGEGRSLASPTPGQQILLHLEPNEQIGTHQTAPRSQTQDGMARLLKRDVSNISRHCNKLRSDGLVASGSRHVEGEAHRRRVYWLTPAGRKSAVELRQSLMEREVEVQTLTGEVKLCRLSEVNGILGVNLPLLQLLSIITDQRRVQADGVPLEQTRFLPALAPDFVGRATELARLEEWLLGEGPSVHHLLGLAGIGKSTLGRVLFEGQRRERPCLWYTITRWDTPETLLKSLSRLMVLMGRPDLESSLQAHARDPFADYLEIISNQFAGRPRPLVILDDIHLLQEPLSGFVADLISYGHPEAGPRWLLIGREPLHQLQGRVEGQTMTCAGLSAEDLAQMLSLDPGSVGQLHESTGGHPLAARLLEHSEGPGRGKLEEFVEGQILSNLVGRERRLAEVVSLQFLPSADDDLLIEGSLKHRHITALEDRGLLVRTEEGLLDVHELVRGSLMSDLSESDRRSLHRSLSRLYRRRIDDEGVLRAIHHFRGAGEQGRVMNFLEKYGEGLIERGHTELFHLLNENEAPRAQLLQARIHLLWGDHSSADETLNQVEVDGDLQESYLAVASLAARARGDLGAAMDAQRRVISGTKESWAVAEAHNELGLCAKMEGDLDSARHHCRTAVEMFERLEKGGIRRSGGSVKALSNLAMIARSDGDLASAASIMRSAIQRAREYRDPLAEARCHFYLGQMLSTGEPDGAREHLELARTEFHSAGDRWGLCRCLIELVRLDKDSDPRRARSAAALALEVARKIRSGPLIAEVESLQTSL